MESSGGSTMVMNLQFFGGRGATADLSYQGKKGYAKASGTGITLDKMYSQITKLSDNSKKDAYDLDVIQNAKNNPDSKIMIYRATPGNQINNGDWIFINPQKAERWTKTALGTPKEGFKVVKKMVSAKEIDWTGKNLEFMYKKGRKK